MIEAASENEELKRKIFASLLPSLRPDAIIASNTSSISITRLAATTDRPERFIGLHFMNPVPAMKLVEIIRGIATEEDTYQSMKGLVEKLGKTSVTAEDFPAFIVNRILLPMINEAVYTLYEGVGTVESIDNAMKLGANHPMGPLGAGRLHRPGYLPRHHAGALRGPRRQQVPPLPAAGEVCRGGLARPQGQARLLRLSRRDPGPDPLRVGRHALAPPVPAGLPLPSPPAPRRHRPEPGRARPMSVTPSSPPAPITNPLTISATLPRSPGTDQAWLRERAPEVRRPALVLDVDETALSNWEVILANDFGRFATGPCQLPEGPCGWAAWDQLGREQAATAHGSSSVEAAGQLGIAVFFITGRPELQRAATERNLREAGYGGFAGLAMVPDGVRYRPCRRVQGATAGRDRGARLHDRRQRGRPALDLAGGHAERTFLLPNPSIGSLERLAVP